jgi:hypothetical protein
MTICYMTAKKVLRQLNLFRACLYMEYDIEVTEALFVIPNVYNTYE